MGTKATYELRDKLCDELDKYARKSDLSTMDLELVHKLTDTIKNIDKIRWLEEGGGYSHAGNWEAVGRMGGNYGREYSSANRGEHYVRGHYSHGDGRSEMMKHLEMALDSADERDREVIRRFIRNLENG